jgi:hypothetical protein
VTNEVIDLAKGSGNRNSGWRGRRDPSLLRRDCPSIRVLQNFEGVWRYGSGSIQRSANRAEGFQVEGRRILTEEEAVQGAYSLGQRAIDEIEGVSAGSPLCGIKQRSG